MERCIREHLRREKMDKNIWMNVMININDNINPKYLSFLLLNRAWDLPIIPTYKGHFSTYYIH